jgi:phage terminase large subunit-like protein
VSAPVDVAGLRQALRTLPPERFAELLAGLPPEQLEALAHDWLLWGRDEQQIPSSDWRVWLLLTGRGWGKTRTLSETVRIWARDPSARIAIVGRTAADCRDVLAEGPAGILSVFPERERPTYLPSVRRIIFRSGAIGTTYSSEEPDTLRGPSHTHAAADELAAWDRVEEVWSNLQLTLRLGAHPRVVVATTPRPIKLLRELMAAKSTVVTRGRTAENQANLSPSALEEFYSRWGNTRLGRQELEGEILSDTPGALWTRALLDATRAAAPPDLQRIVVAIDPAISANEGSDLTGIVAVGRDRKGDIYVLRDVSCKASPAGWARRAVDLYDALAADRIVCEANQGGAMCEATLRTVRRNLPISLVHASRGKVTRAEPIAALWEQGRGHVVGVLPDLEDELCSFAPGLMEHSPDRADAAVWGATFLAGPRSSLATLEALAGMTPSPAAPLVAAEPASKPEERPASQAGLLSGGAYVDLPKVGAP